MALQPPTRIFLGLSLILFSSALAIYPLIAIFLGLGIWLALCRDLSALRWVRRARFLLIVPPLLTGYIVPGTGILPIGLWAPTWEGLALGATQSLRLLVALLSLRVALGGLSTAQLAEGLVGFLSPLSWFNINVSQLARRLTLTLEYMERMDGRTARNFLVGFCRSNSPE